MQPLKILTKRLINSNISQTGHLSLLRKNLKDYGRLQDSAFSDFEHLNAAAEWLGRAQDKTKNGGISGRYSLKKGWTSAYPETTGYIIPTFLRLSYELNLTRFVNRAEDAVRFLLKLQMKDGSFPGNEIDENTNIPSIFDTAQIIHGLLHWYIYSKEEKVLDSAIRAGKWLVSVQDDDGAWRKAVYLDQVYTYSAHASCWLAELGVQTGTKDFIDSASKHLNWVLKQQDNLTSWFDLAGFTAEDHAKRIAVTHTIAYTLWGVLYISQKINDSNATNAIEKAALKIVETQERYNYIPGTLNYKWEPESKSICLTGNAQLALIWLELYKIHHNKKFLNAAFEAINSIKKIQSFTNPNPGICGGIPGSYPIWGNYISMALPNWAAKFFIDSLFEKMKVSKEENL